MPEKLTLNDGTVLEGASALASGDLFVYVPESDIRTVFGLLIEPENTEEIVYTRNNGEKVDFRGYVRLTAVRDEGAGLITAVLKRREVEADGI